MALRALNPHSEVSRNFQALYMNITAARGLQEVLRSNLGPSGTLKMLVNSGGDIKITKDGNVLLHEMQIQHPIASLIARAATAQDEITGDGTTSCVLIIGEILKQSERYLAENVHPRLLADGIDLAKTRALEVLDKLRVAAAEPDRELLLAVARTSLRTKVAQSLADSLTEMVVDGVLTVRRPELPIDLFMVEIMTMQHRTETESRFVRGLVLDHGARHPDMPKRLSNAFILTCNVSLEFEKSEVHSDFLYSSAQQRDKLVESERRFTDEKVRKIIDFKRSVCTAGQSFVVVNQKGIDPMSLDMLAKEGILALRRAKRRNMERLTLACGGVAVNAVDDLVASDLGFAESIYEQVLGEEKFTFIEGVRNPLSCTILLKGPNQHTINQLKDAVRDGLRAVKNVLEDHFVVPGAGAFELAAYTELTKYKETIKGRQRLGVQAFAEGLLIIPKTLARNSGFDSQDAIISLQAESSAGHTVGLNLATGEPFEPQTAGIWDNYQVKRQQLTTSAVLASQLLLVDEIIKAGKGQAQAAKEQAPGQ